MSCALSVPAVRTIEAAINYVAPGSFINRRFVAPGIEHNTGRYEAHRVAVRDFFDKEDVERIYPAEVAAAVLAVTGATRVAQLGWMVRASGDLSRHQKETVGYTHRGGVQPPAGEAHVDFTPARAEPLARAIYARNFPDGKGFTRFIASSL